MFRAVIVLMGAVILIAAAPASPSPRPHIATERQGPEQGIGGRAKPTNHENAAPKIVSPINEEVEAKITTDRSQDSQAKEGYRGMDWPAWVEAFSAFITAAFTGLLFVATYRLWNSTKGLHGETKRLAELADTQSLDMKASIEVARDAAEAAKRSADAAIGAERAWLLLTIDSDNIEDALLQRIEPDSWPTLIEKEPIKPCVRFHFDNRGKTPAFIREAAMEMVISVGVPDRILAEPLAPWWPEEIIVPANGRYPTRTDDDGNALERQTNIYRDFSDEEAKLFDVNSGAREHYFWFYGHVIYTDVWNNLRMTRFCLANDGWSGWHMPQEAMQYNERT